MSRQVELCKLGADVVQRIIKLPEIARVNLALTWRCNHKCLTCNLWQTKSKDLITLGDVDKLINRNHLMWLSLTGGEPTLNPYFREILALSSSKLRMVNVITNGSRPIYLEQSAKKALINSSLIIIHVSLIGNKEFHDKITGIPGSFEQVIDTIERLKALKNDKLLIGLEHMLCSYNAGQAPFVRDLAQKLGVGLTYVEEQKSGYYNNLENVVKPAPLPPKDYSGNPIDVFKNAYLFKTRKNKGIKCVSGAYSCFITPNKDVFPCLFAIPEYPAFNLVDHDYKLGKEMRSSQFVRNCSDKCWTPCESYTTVMFRPWRILS